MQVRADHAREEIARGRLSYSSRCGWVDWGHARGDGPRQLIADVMAETPSVLSASDQIAIDAFLRAHRLQKRAYFAVVYSQQMTKDTGVLNPTAGVRTVYLVKRGQPLAIRQGIAWRIFKQVSMQFERLQADLPYSLVPSTLASSFGIGDLTGNKISFYTALGAHLGRRLDRAWFERACGAYDARRSLSTLARQKNPAGQRTWRRIPGLREVSRIPRGVVRTVLSNQSFMEAELADASAPPPSWEELARIDPSRGDREVAGNSRATPADIGPAR